MRAEERSRDVYERVPGYQQPPLPPLPAPRDFSTLRQVGVIPGGPADTLISAALGLAGYRAFERDLPQNIERLLRAHNLRLPGVYAPVISATLALQDDPRPLTPIERAATLVVAACALRDDIFCGALPADTFRDEPLEMGQYPNVFSTNLVVNDRGVSVFKTTAVDRLQVMIGGRLCSLTLANAAGPLRVEDVGVALAAVAETGALRPLAEGELPAGLLTAATAPVQRRAFAALRRAPAGAAALERTKHALMTVCFELDSHPVDAAEAAWFAHARHPENRWFHSSLQLVVFGNGKAAALCNFSTYLDGNTMMRVGAELQRRAAGCELVPQATSPAPRKAEEIIFPASPELAPLVAAARRDWDAAQDRDNRQVTFTLEGIGRHALKGPGVEPVPAFICALAATAKGLTGRHPPITQFFTMSRYRCMDMVTGSVTTAEVEQFADALIEGGEKHALRELLVSAVSSQQEAARELRRAVPLPTLLSLYVREQQGFRKRFALMSQMGMGGLLKVMGRMKPAPREILVSHPEIYPEVPVVGRPGVRLPYVTCFGLHYQIWENKTVITMMPGATWKTPNEALITQLAANLAKVCVLLN